jgi:hypothetical protein
MPVKCEQCGSDELTLVRKLEDGRRELRCEACGATWLRGEIPIAPHTPTAVQSPVPKSQPPILGWGPVRTLVSARVDAGTRLSTFSAGKPFTVSEVDDEGVVLLLADKHRTPITWGILEGVAIFIREQRKVRVGSGYTVEGEAGTLDGYLKPYVQRAVAGWVAVLLEVAGVVRINTERPATIRLTEEAEALMLGTTKTS